MLSDAELEACAAADAAWLERVRATAIEQVGAHESRRLTDAFLRMTPREQRRYERMPIRQAKTLGVFRARRGSQSCARPRGAGRPATRRKTVRSSSRSGDSGSDSPLPPRPPAFARNQRGGWA